ncbi:MAG: caspase family protein [Pirellulaceae bacterium]
MRHFIVLFLLACASAASAESPSKLVPENTYAVIVGVLSWQENSLTKYPAELRQDVALHQQLQALGVPAENMALLLDKAATRDAINEAVEATAKKAGDDSTLIIYYAGHGMTHEGEGVFACYDIDTRQMTETGWRHKRLTESIESNFHGDIILLLADCCFSGTLQNVAKRLSERGFHAASLTSAGSENESTNNWTFTLSLVQSLGGHPVCDENADGVITLAETASEVKLAMSHFEHQRHGYSTHELSHDFQLATTRRDPILATAAKEKNVLNYQFGQYVAARPDNKWTTARVLSVRESESGKPQLLIQCQAYNDRPTAWVAPESVRPITAAEQAKLPPDPLPEEEAKQMASLDGQLTNLLAKIYVEQDWKMYGSFHNFGKWSSSTYYEHRDLPTGHWVYVYPHWYIWQVVAADFPAIQMQAPRINRIFAIPDWHAKQMTGPPNTQGPGDQVTAWAPATMDDRKVWVELDYKQAITPKEIHIHENCAPGTVYQVTTFVDKQETLLWKGVDPTPIDAAMGISKIAVDTDAKLSRIRIYLNCALAPGWNEIDAVALVDANDKQQWAFDARASCTYNQPDNIPFVDPFQTETDRKAEKWAVVKAKIQAHKNQVRQYEAAIRQQNAAIKKLYEELENE